MSFPKPSADMKNSNMPIGKADIKAATAKMSSSSNLPAVAKQRARTPMIANPPEIPVTIGVTCVMSLIGAPHSVCVLFCASLTVSLTRSYSRSQRTERLNQCARR
jgi:phosphoribosylcarboxyaminoimidazole (NCAIR) mutase